MGRSVTVISPGVSETGRSVTPPLETERPVFLHGLRTVSAYTLIHHTPSIGDTPMRVSYPLSTATYLRRGMATGPTCKD